jgi:branched-chain amino acid transport system permease protein
MTAGLFLQALVAGAAAGAVYGVIGLGYALIYRMSGVLNFAHGDLVTAGVFCFLLVVGGGGAVALVGLSPAVLLLGVAVAVLAAALIGVAIQRLAVSPFLARGSSLGWIGGTVAAGLLLRALVGMRFQAESYTVPEILPGLGAGGAIPLPGGGVMQPRTVVVLVMALALALAFDRWLAASRTGRGMRAVAQDADAARLCGVSPERLRLVAWALAGVLAAVAGLLVAPSRPLTLDVGIILGLKGTAAAVLGRLGSARGTVLAGLAIGVGESIVTTLYIPPVSLGTLRLSQLGPLPGLQDVGPLLVLVLVLALLPGLVRDAREVVD